MAASNCTTGLQPSRIPGNIGTLHSKVIVWDHDPFWARPTQVYSFSFTKAAEGQLPETIDDIIFEAGAAFLRPIFRNHDMFICTLNKNKEVFLFTEETSANPEVDFVGSVESGVGLIASSRLPGGEIFECDGGGIPLAPDNPCIEANNTTGKSIFSHQVWKHIGSILDNTVLIHPSEYQKPLSELLQSKINTTIEELQSSAKWDYSLQTSSGKEAIYPIMVSKQSPHLQNTVHWTLEKWTPVWQGQDFYITVLFGDKDTDDALDSSAVRTTLNSLADNYYPYMWHDIGDDGFQHILGISNEAFYIPPKIDDTGTVNLLTKTKAKEASRLYYDWRLQTYILIEIGSFDANHNYFIELVKGRNPRFLHLGEEWDNRNRLNTGIKADSKNPTAGFDFVKKCRVLSEYDGIVTDQLFRQKDFRVSVRNHLGRIVVTFSGQEGNPWVITRQDNNPRKVDFSKIIVPMVVPAARLRLHGGNISCAINYSPTEYYPSATMPFYDRQVDTGPNNDNTKATNEDVYLTFSHVGNAIKTSNANVQKKFFSDPRFKYDKIGYDCDAFSVVEKNRNSSLTINIYNEYDKQYRTYGKGWYNETPRTTRDWVVERDDITLLPKNPVLINGMDSDNGGTPSQLKIINLRNPAFNFPLFLDEAVDSHYEWKDYVAKWDVGVELRSGSIKLNNPTGVNSMPIDTTGINAKVFENYVTPIATSWRIIVLGGGKPFEGSVNPFDIAPLVSKINDSWSAEDYVSLSHEMKIECYIPIESTSNISLKVSDDKELENIFSIGRKLLPLHDKAFYVTVSYWWDTGVGHRYVESNENNQAGDDPNTNDVLIQMTGVAYGAQLTRSNNLLTMSFTVKDYMSILENQYIFNSPFFDAVQDVQAIYELAKMAGFADLPNRASGIDRRPLGYLRKVIDDGDRIGERLFLYNGEKSRSERYDLPGSYSSLTEPSMKFQNGETYESAIKRIAQLSGKTMYFDRWGVLRVETPGSVIAAFSSVNEKLEFIPVFDFVTTPIARQSNIPNQGGNTADTFVFDPTVHAAHLVYNSVTYQRSVEDCVNQIVVLSASNSIKLADGSTAGGLIVEGYSFFDQMWNPEAEGFIGYRKPLYQSEGAFGSIEGVRNAISIYAKQKFPPVIMSFETYGVPGLKALDIVTLDGNLAYITEITHDLDPKTNQWWMNVTTEWLKPIKGELGFLEATEPDTGGG